MISTRNWISISESENSETIGGFILDILGEIPDEEDVG